MFSLIVEVPSDFKAEFYSTVRLYHIFFFLPHFLYPFVVNGHLSCSHILTIVNSVATSS